MIEKMQLIEDTYTKLSGQRFQLDLINKFIFSNFPMRFQDISEDDLKRFCSGKSINYPELAWAIDDSIPFFSMIKSQRALNDEEITCCIFLLLAMRELIDRKAIDFSYLFERMFEAYTILHDTMRPVDLLAVFKAAFCGKPL